MNTDVRVVEAKASFQEEILRTPLKFGTGVITYITGMTAEVAVESRNGRRASGLGNILLSDIWAFPSATLNHETRDRAMRMLGERICEAYAACEGYSHPLALSWEVKAQLEALAADLTREQGLAEPVPLLAALVCASPADAALHDAFGRLLGISTYDAYGPDLIDHDLSRYLGPDFAERYLSEFIKPVYRPEIPIFHLVGGLDKLTCDEITDEDPDDGLPVSLDQWIEREELSCFKVKITGKDIDWDVERTAAVAELAYSTRTRLGLDATFYISVDSNEQHEGPEAVVEYLEKLRERSALAYRMLLYLEQPTERDLEASRFDMRPVAALKPVIVDEGVTDLGKLELAHELGWSGVGLKTCKGHAASLLYAARCQAEGMLITVQDLTNPGLSLVHSAGLASRLPTLMGVEYNARQYLPSSQADVQARHRTLFTVRGGKVSLKSLAPVGLGY